MTAADGIKRIIKEKGFKKCIVAEKAGYTKENFSRMLNGRKRILADDVPRICKALGVTPNDIYSNSI